MRRTCWPLTRWRRPGGPACPPPSTARARARARASLSSGWAGRPTLHTGGGASVSTGEQKHRKRLLFALTWRLLFIIHHNYLQHLDTNLTHHTHLTEWPTDRSTKFWQISKRAVLCSSISPTNANCYRIWNPREKNYYGCESVSLAFSPSGRLAVLCYYILPTSIYNIKLCRYENPPDSPPPQSKSGHDDVTPSRVIRPSSSLVNIGRARNDDWSVSTSSRFFKFSPEGFNMARSAPIVHQPTLKIGLEGQREFSVSNSDHFPAYNVR